MKHLSISGGGFAISGLAGAAYQVIKSGYKPDIISGVSSGAILSFILSASKNALNEIEENSIGFNQSVAFKHPPLNSKGNPTIRSIFNIITKNYLSSQKELENTLKKFVSIKEWNDYRNDPKGNQCWVISVDFYTGSRKKYNLKEYSYEDAIKIVRSSCSIPIFSDGVKFEGEYLFDGGVRNHIPSEWVVENIEGITENVNIYSRPENFNKVKFDKDLDSSVEILLRTIQIMEWEISKSNERMTDLICLSKGISNKTIYLPKVLKNPYEINLEAQKFLYEEGKKNASKLGFTF